MGLGIGPSRRALLPGCRCYVITHLPDAPVTSHSLLPPTLLYHAELLPLRPRARVNSPSLRWFLSDISLQGQDKLVSWGESGSPLLQLVPEAILICALGIPDLMCPRARSYTQTAAELGFKPT